LGEGEGGRDLGGKRGRGTNQTEATKCLRPKKKSFTAKNKKSELYKTNTEEEDGEKVGGVKKRCGGAWKRKKKQGLVFQMGKNDNIKREEISIKTSPARLAWGCRKGRGKQGKILSSKDRGKKSKGGIGE